MKELKKLWKSTDWEGLCLNLFGLGCVQDGIRHLFRQTQH